MTKPNYLHCKVSVLFPTVCQDAKDTQATLQRRVDELEDRLSREQSGRQHDTRRAQQLHSQLGNLIQELSGMHQDMAEIL